MAHRDLTQGERVLILLALEAYASQQQLQQINSDLLAERDGNDADSVARLRAAAVRCEETRSACASLAALAIRGNFRIESPVIIVELR